MTWMRLEPTLNRSKLNYNKKKCSRKDSLKATANQTRVESQMEKLLQNQVGRSQNYQEKISIKEFIGTNSCHKINWRWLKALLKIPCKTYKEIYTCSNLESSKNKMSSINGWMIPWKNKRNNLSVSQISGLEIHLWKVARHKQAMNSMQTRS